MAITFVCFSLFAKQTQFQFLIPLFHNYTIITSTNYQKKSNRCANQSVNPSTSSGLVLKAAHREAERSVVDAHVGIAAVEAEVARIGTTNRTAPTDAVGTDIVERTTAAGAAARHRQLKWGGKSPHRCICTPT